MRYSILCTYMEYSYIYFSNEIIEHSEFRIFKKLHGGIKIKYVKPTKNNQSKNKQTVASKSQYSDDLHNTNKTLYSKSKTKRNSLKPLSVGKKKMILMLLFFLYITVIYKYL